MDFLSKEGGRRCFILASDKNEKDHNKSAKHYCAKQDDHKATNLEIQNKQNGSRSTNHESQTMTFWTRASKHVFPKRFAKIIDGTEIPKNMQNAQRDTTNFAIKGP